MTVEYTTRQMADTKCPRCEHPFNSVASEHGDLPNPNDFSLCAYCGEFLRFNENLELSVVSDSEVLKEKDGDNILLDLYTMRSYVLSDDFVPPKRMRERSKDSIPRELDDTTFIELMNLLTKH